MPWLLLLAFLSSCSGQTLTLTGPAAASPGATIPVSLMLISPGPDLAALQWTLDKPSGSQATADGGPAGIAAEKTLSCAGDLCLLHGLNATEIQTGVVAQYILQVPSTSGHYSITCTGLLGASGLGETVAVTSGAPYVIEVAASGPPYPVTDLRVQIQEASAEMSTTIGPISIAANGDDGNVFDGTYSPNGDDGSSDWIGADGTKRQWGYFRFALPSAIPSGATIEAGTKIELYGTDSYAWDSGSEYLQVYTQQSADSAQVSSGSEPTVTTAVVRWPASGGLSWSTSQYNEIDITAVIQELVDDYGGLASGAHIQIWVAGPAAQTGWLACRDYNGAAGANVAKLTIVYTAGGEPPAATIVPDDRGINRGIARGMNRGMARIN